MLEDSLTNRNLFVKRFAGQPNQDLFSLQEVLHNQFLVRFELDSKSPAAELNVVSLREMILTIAYRDFARGAHYQIGGRKDWPQPLFTVETKHKRKYCSQYCGHLESMRKKRKGKKHGKKR